MGLLVYYISVKIKCFKGSNGEGIRPSNKSRWGWRLRTNEETDLPLKHADIFRFITARRIRWIGRHIVRVDKERTVKRSTEWRPVTVRRIGRLRSRWEDVGKIEDS